MMMMMIIMTVTTTPSESQNLISAFIYTPPENRTYHMIFMYLKIKHFSPYQYPVTNSVLFFLYKIWYLNIKLKTSFSSEKYFLLISRKKLNFNISLFKKSKN